MPLTPSELAALRDIERDLQPRVNWFRGATPRAGLVLVVGVAVLLGFGSAAGNAAAVVLGVWWAVVVPAGWWLVRRYRHYF